MKASPQHTHTRITTVHAPQSHQKLLLFPQDCSSSCGIMGYLLLWEMQQLPCLVPMSPPGSPFLTLFIYLFGEPELRGSASPSIPSLVIFHQPIHSQPPQHSCGQLAASVEAGRACGRAKGQAPPSRSGEFHLCFTPCWFPNPTETVPVKTDS